jgi:hypothetical protein
MNEWPAPAYPIQVPENIYDRIHVLSRRQARQQRRIMARLGRRRRRADRRAWRRQHPWFDRWPNVARILWWTLILATIAFFLFCDRLTPYLPKR